MRLISMKTLGFSVTPNSTESRHDIIQAVTFGNPEGVIEFCKGIQAAAPVDSYVEPEPWAMPGYDSDVIMAAGAFVQGLPLNYLQMVLLSHLILCVFPRRTYLVSCKIWNFNVPAEVSRKKSDCFAKGIMYEKKKCVHHWRRRFRNDSRFICRKRRSGCYNSGA